MRIIFGIIVLAVSFVFCGNLAYAESVSSVENDNSNVKNVNLSSFQKMAQKFAHIDVPLMDKTDKNFPDEHWELAAEMVSGRNDSIVFLYSVGKEGIALGKDNDPIHKELKIAAQHLIADPDCRFSGIINVKSPDGLARIKGFIDGKSYDTLTFGYSKGNEGVEYSIAGHGGVMDVVLTSTKDEWDILQEAKQIWETKQVKPKPQDN
jgi:hypothetical protein